jgi:hypothetical protein
MHTIFYNLFANQIISHEIRLYVTKIWLLIYVYNAVFTIKSVFCTHKIIIYYMYSYSRVKILIFELVKYYIMIRFF